MNTPALVIGCAGVGALALIVLGLALARGAALADRRAPLPPIPHPTLPSPHPTPSSTDAPNSTAARALDAYEIRARALADTWHRKGRLSHAGYLRLCELMYAGLDVYPYWSGGELRGTAVVWDGTRGPHGAGERLTVEEWNADAEHSAEGAGVQLDASDDPAPSDDLDAHLCPTCGRRLAWHLDAGEYCAICAPASFMLHLDALDAERRRDPRRYAGEDGGAAC